MSILSSRFRKREEIIRFIKILRNSNLGIKEEKKDYIEREVNSLKSRPMKENLECLQKIDQQDKSDVSKQAKLRGLKKRDFG